MGISAPGVGSNLDVNGIVSQLMAVERRPLTLLAQREADFQAKLSAFGTLKGALSAFQTAMQGLADGTKFQAGTASAADVSVLTAAASGKVVPGSYSVEVQQLAQQQKIHSDGFASTSSAVGSGTLTIQYGTYDSGANTFTLNSEKSAQTVTIDPSSNTLSGVRDAINAANIGISATIINDGTSDRLVVTGKDTGAANSFRITASDDDGANLDTAGLSRIAFDPTAAVGSGKNLTQVQTAQDAKLEIDGIAISKLSNTITDAIEGVTLNLLKTNTGSPTMLNVARDSAGVKASVEAFVKSFNSVNQTLTSLSAYNAATGQGAILQGDSATMSIQSWIRSTLSASVSGISDSASSITSLSQIGVAFQKDGTLALDSVKLQTALDNNFDDIAGLFAVRGKPTDGLIAYSGSTDKTAVGSYAVTVTQLATQASLTGSQAAGLTITAGVNDQLNISADGVVASVTLAAGTYASADALAAEVQSKLNGAASLADAGISVLVSQAAGVLSITSATYGPTSGVAIIGGNGASDLMGASPVSTTGVDVAGTINGVAATGVGQVLTAAVGDAAEGLSLAVNGGLPGARGTVAFSRGYADRLDKLMEDLLTSDGIIAGRTDGITASIEDIDRRQEDFSRRLTAIEARYRAQFTALDVMLSSLTQTSEFFQQQLDALQKNNS
ncbi:flagellar hook-associated protein 2 [Nitrosospira sp. Nl5]|uniref:flagellar filament capping protein FliD n=1 Tax=Nitrosospira sp. Nl5 TaxID=200120 RepID=UPI0008837E65|nr:flagellar filament capping protein FliD [Nitrosospira sp. Nl5]SCY07443.1 flagellar hook-associated protein 2 [Nitrosospira sp. Nl5]